MNNKSFRFDLPDGFWCTFSHICRSTVQFLKWFEYIYFFDFRKMPDNSVFITQQLRTREQVVTMYLKQTPVIGQSV